MAMPQRDAKVDAIKRLQPPSRVRYGAPGTLLGHAVMHTKDVAEKDGITYLPLYMAPLL